MRREHESSKKDLLLKFRRAMRKKDARISELEVELQQANASSRTMMQEAGKMKNAILELTSEKQALKQELEKRSSAKPKAVPKKTVFTEASSVPMKRSVYNQLLSKTIIEGLEKRRRVA